MIINTGMRTDIVQYYTDWLLKRFEAGFVFSRNPIYNYNVTRYELNPNLVDCVVFCSKNYSPIIKDLHRITDRFNTHFQYTITAYGKDIEPIFGPDRKGDIKHSNADITKAKAMLGYDPEYDFARGLNEAIEWYRANL